MLKMRLLAVGDRMPAWVKQGFDEYARRIRGRYTLELLEISAIKRTTNSNLAKIAEDEEDKIRAHLGRQDKVIALDRIGKSLSTLDMSRQMDQWLQDGDHACLIIGGPEGLSDSFLKSCDAVWSLSSMTFAHPVARVVVAEQIYRCCSILDGLPYHR